ncbi:EAL domain-containing protein [Piscinibacter koreensis]|uniref:EAL domain-containing protein n=1 Tax=Piscinibacter koreensis TaxID=2742824 RepID=A0A7Y6NQ33_9BURK|nr:EAL domain-containing protein [Schlegelella koreensis]NUZ07239.1 EAL domain-containing protein [Schlegelella koreensis]
MIAFVTRLLARFSVSRKLMLIYLLDLSAVIFISGILIHEKFIAIDFARKELAGNAYIAEARDALLAIARREPGAASGSELEHRAAAIETAERRWGTGMQTLEASRVLANELRRLAAHAGAPRVASAPVQQHALEQARALITRVGNQSNLILDPDLDSYYTMSVVLLRYPELTEIVASIHELLGASADGRPLPPHEASTRYLILEGRLTAVAKGIESDQAEGFAAASDPRLAAALQPAQTALMASIERFRAASRARLEAASAGPAAAPREGGDAGDATPLRSAELALLASLERAWQAGSAELDRLLEARIDGFFARMWLHLGTALVMLLVLLSAVFFVASQITRPLRRLSGVAERVRSSGDYGLRAHWQSSDEIGRLVRAFNDMLQQLDHQREVQQELAATTRASEAQQLLLESTPIPMVVTAIPGHEVLHANRPAEAWLGGRATDPWASGLDGAVRRRFFQQLADREQVDEFEVRWKGGREPAWALLSARRLMYQGRDAVLTAFTPINQIKVMERRLELWAKVFEASSEGIMIIDGDHRILSVNRAFCRHTDHEAGEVLGDRPELLLTDEHSARFPGIWPIVDRRGSWQGEVQVRRRSETSYPAWLVVSAVRDGQSGISHYIWTLLDITDRKASEERIHFLAHHDVLTGLPNRLLFTERLRMAMQHAKRESNRVAVLFIDLDRFKTINDSLGHHVGDGLLRSVSARLLDAVRTGDTVSRLGGDEFVIALHGIQDADEVLGIVERRLVPLIRQPHVAGGAELHVTCSVGISMYPDDSRDLDEVMRHADVAMYQAKALGRDGVQFFTPELNERAHKRLRLESRLRHAADRSELALHYQPRVAAASGRMVAVEALLRWDSPELGCVQPAEFIPIAEESRLIVPIGAWVVREACRQHAAWKAAGYGAIPISINVSALQLRDPALVGTLDAALAEFGVEPAALELELTESTLMEAVEETLAQLHALKRLGVKLSVDDFGTGYSSLNYLNRFPIDRLKIDRSFVRRVLDDPADLAITRAIVGLGHTLGLQVVAEGVETEAVAAELRAAACDELQGFVFAPALPAAELIAWLVERRAKVGSALEAATPTI